MSDWRVLECVSEDWYDGPVAVILVGQYGDQEPRLAFRLYKDNFEHISHSTPPGSPDADSHGEIRYEAADIQKAVQRLDSWCTVWVKKGCVQLSHEDNPNPDKSERCQHNDYYINGY